MKIQLSKSTVRHLFEMSANMDKMKQLELWLCRSSNILCKSSDASHLKWWLAVNAPSGFTPSLIWRLCGLLHWAGRWLAARGDALWRCVTAISVLIVDLINFFVVNSCIKLRDGDKKDQEFCQSSWIATWTWKMLWLKVIFRDITWENR